MYSIETSPFGSAEALRLTNKTTSEYVEVIPALGAIVNAFVINTASGPLSVIEGFKDDRDFRENNGSTFRSSKLFPFPNRIRNGQYEFQGKTYRLPLNFPQEQNSIHGFVLDVPFRVVSVSGEENSCSVSLSYQSEGIKGYPFPFDLVIDYRYSGNSLLCLTTILNTGNKSMPYGDGWHHYFTCGGSIDGLAFSFPSTHLFPVDKQMIPTGKMTDYREFSNPEMIGNTKFDTCFSLKKDSEALIKLIDKQKKLALSLEFASAEYPYLQVYTPPHRKSIAIEPMSCAPDAFNNGLGLRMLEPGSSGRFSFSISAQAER